MQPLKCDLRCPAAKDNSIGCAAAARNLDAAINYTIRFAETELQSTIELRATASEIAAPKPDLDAKAKKRRFCSPPLIHLGGVRQEFFENCFTQPRWVGVLRMSDFSPGLWRFSETERILPLPWNFSGMASRVSRAVAPPPFKNFSGKARGEKKTWKCGLQLVCTHLTTSTGARWCTINSAIRFSIALFYRI